jgi:hypothetical protein
MRARERKTLKQMNDMEKKKKKKKAKHKRNMGGDPRLLTAFLVSILRFAQ